MFTLYAINSAALCFVLSTTLLVIDDTHELFMRILDWVFEYSFVMFGPILLVLSIQAMINIASELQGDQCDLGYFMQQVSQIDMFVLSVVTTLSALVTFLYALQKTNAWVKAQMEDGESLFYRAYKTRL